MFNNAVGGSGYDRRVLTSYVYKKVGSLSSFETTFVHNLYCFGDTTALNQVQLEVVFGIFTNL